MADFDWKIKLSPQNSHSFGMYQHGFLEWELARATVVQDKLEEVTLRMAGVAKARLEMHRDTGASRIKTDKELIDHYVVLDDSRSGPEAAAHLIEMETEALHSAVRLTGGKA